MPTFPEDFVFGAATASYQIEGAVHEGGRGTSIWDTFSHTPGRVDRGDTGDVACDHYHRWTEDLDILAELGVDAYRFSVAWPRIQPTGVGSANQAGLDFYSRLVDGLLARGITPFVTLYHWDLPQTLEDKGGWRDRDTAYRFADYADLVARELGDRVGEWATLNEPWCAAMLGYGSGVHAPGVANPKAALDASHHLNLAHGLGVQALRASTTSPVGIVVNVHQLWPASDSEQDMDAWARADAVGNWMYLDPILKGRYDDLTLAATAKHSSWEVIADGDLDIISQPIDFVGLNYYSGQYVAGGGTSEGHTPWVGAEDARFILANDHLTDMGWAIIPRGLTDLLVRVHERYPDIDLIVSENGAAMVDVVSDDGAIHDADRIAYLEGHIGAVADALALGVPVKGYYEWSLLDNFEWALGCSKRFGIVRVDYDTQARTWKDSAKWYQSFLATRTLGE
ncbi:MAG: beta-glucosidase [Propionibacteriaceae bacterium]|jgi:beta-glucosidase|nr:beta-glucosidase [Propionibacteriaceae bacterium]